MSDWKNVKDYPLAKTINEDGYNEVLVIEDDFKIMALLISNSIHSNKNPGKKTWEKHVARIGSEEGELINMDGDCLEYTYEDVHYWQELPEDPYQLNEE